MRAAHQFFWQKYPALSLGITIFFGALAFFEQTVGIALIWLGYLLILYPLRSLFHGLLLVSIFLFSSSIYSKLPNPGQGHAIFSIHSVRSHSSPFHKGWLYQGTLQAFQSTEGRWALHLPCSIVYTGDPHLRPPANGDYIVSGQLRKRGSYDYIFKAKSWEKISNTWSLAELRYQAKEKVHSILNLHLKDPHTSTFLAALFTGDIENRILRFEFSRLGLQYLLVISGFHFAILSAFVAFALRQIIASRKRLWFLLAAISTYFLFVGNSPPVLRSFLAATIFLLGQLLERKTSALNILGACLLIEVVADPVIVRDIGFQLSFLSCFGIFLLNQPIRSLIQWFFPVRKFSEAIKFSIFAQCGYILSSFFSQALQLTLAVNLILAPLLLYHFHRFPWLGLLYNLFAPAWTALSLFLLLATLTLYVFFPLFSIPLFKFVGLVAGNLLEMIGHPPALLDYGISYQYPGWALAPYIALLFTVSLWYQEKQKEPLKIISH